MSAVALPIVGAGTLVAPLAAADPPTDLSQAVVALRGSAQCGPLRYDPTVEHAAEIVNRSTYEYLRHTAINVPIEDAQPTAILKDLGIDTDRILSLKGAGHNGPDAIKGVMLEGRDAIRDCSYTDFGASFLYEEQTGFTLATVVLVGR
ncbi:hypothetical protein BST36_23525 [Mycolicibacterium moriokaense]|nr:hypothetical protein [Mycolicibacterium moriokaense]ORB18593.1 hypothetical protein BST36_23525 [Mycolicibacterium moriokaense]